MTEDKEVKLLVGKYDFRSKKLINTPGYSNLLIHVKENLSPYTLTEDDCIMENLYQADKVYPKVYKQQQTIHKYTTTLGWCYPSDIHIENNKIAPAYWKWREKLRKFKHPVRYPNGWDNRHTVAFSLVEDEKGDEVDPFTNKHYRRVGYVESRIYNYYMRYAKLARAHPAFNKLKERLIVENLKIYDVDGPYYAKEFPYNQVKDDYIPVTEEIVKAMLNNTSQPFGHALALSVALLDKDEWVVPKPNKREISEKADNKEN